MKVNKTLIYLLSIGSILTSSCSKFLDQDPVSTSTDATSWKADGDANSQVAGCYSLIRSALNAACSFYTYGDLPTDYWETVQDADYKNIFQTNWAISVSSLNTYDPKLKLRVWTPFYSAIQQSNRCLHFLPQMSLDAFDGDTPEAQQAKKNKYIAEAKFCRAFNYFYISRVWGDVPLDTTYQEDISSITSDPRVAQTQVLNAAISDLKYATQWLDYRDASSEDQVVRGDKGASFALLAHIYAWRGQYDSAKLYCDSVINDGGYTLVGKDNIADIYKGQSTEGIFEIAQDKSTEAMIATQYSASVALYTLAAPYLPTNTVPNWQIDSTKLLSLFSDTSDARYQANFASVNSGAANYYFCKKYSNIEKVTANSVNYYLLLNNIIIFRLADIYLLRAEAEAANSNTSAALSDINIIRSRAGIKNMENNISSKNALLDSITDERSRELFLEGTHFYDLVRNERLTGKSQFKYITQADFQKGKYYWPVDPSLMQLNAGLTQTPYWQQLLTY